MPKSHHSPRGAKGGKKDKKGKPVIGSSSSDRSLPPAQPVPEPHGRPKTTFLSHLIHDDSEENTVNPTESEQVLLRAASELRSRMERDLTARELHMVVQLENAIQSLLASPAGDAQRSWLGMFPYRLRNEIGHPTDEAIRTLVLPSAYETLLRVNQLSMDARFNVGPDHPVCNLDEALAAIVRLMIGERWTDARQLINIAIRSFPQDLRLYKMLAIVTVYDRVLNWRNVRIAEALRLFQRLQDPDAEVMALRGDLGHMLWEVDKSDVSIAERAVQDYQKSFRLAKEAKLGPPGLGYGLSKAVMLLIELYNLRHVQGGSPTSLAQVARRQAEAIMMELVDALTSYRLENPRADVEFKQHWFGLALGNLGLGRLSDARDSAAMFASLLSKVRTTDDYLEMRLREFLGALCKIVASRNVALPLDEKVDEWEPEWRVVRDMFAPMFDVTHHVILSTLRGRVGLALSGGGIRASFLHLGLLARLAECDVLRQVGAVSAVSGGSIVAMMYYLGVKALLESKRDEDITREDYVKLVQDMIAHFIGAMTKDMHFSTFLNPVDNLKVAFGSTRRIELLADQMDSQFFDRWVELVHGPGRPGPLKMRKIRIHPLGWPLDRRFNPRQHNWSRQAVAPALYLNAVNLNTGHVWRFTAAYMGEKADLTGAELGVDSNLVLESVFYDEAYLQEHRDIPVSHCVAVTALIPGLVSAPYALDGLYPGVKVRLADGSVFDNAGVESLYGAGVDVVIVNNQAQTLSDVATNPPETSLSTVLRVLEINLDLNFERVYAELAQKAASHGIRDVVFIHMRQSDGEETATERESLLLHRRIQPRKRVNLKKVTVSKDFARTAQHHRAKSVPAPTPTHAEPNYSDGGGWPAPHPQHQHQVSAPETVQAVSLASAGGGADAAVAAGGDSRSAAPPLERSFSGLQQTGSGGVDLTPPMDEVFLNPDLMNLRRVAQESVPLSYGDLITSMFPEVRTSMDRMTEVEMHLLMAHGYRLTSDALKTLASATLKADASAEDVCDMVVRPGLPLASLSLTGPAASSLDRAPTECIAGRWALFDVTCDQEEWEFSSMKRLLDEADAVPVPRELYPKPSTGNILQGKDQLARAVRLNRDAAHIAENPALVSVFQQLDRASGQISFIRVLSASRVATLLLLLACLASVGGIIYGLVDSLLILIDEHGLWYSECLCLLGEPIFYITLFVAMFVLLVQPGYVTSLLWATLLAPLSTFVSVHFFDAMLSSHGQLGKVVDLDSDYRRAVGRPPRTNSARPPSGPQRLPSEPSVPPV